ncbi:Disease resistance protein [Corchorus olitorius]|uniref:Disease resistance protein n=1 Tax=Corchorus olitorius TaxID=93759 RepID=A0A1R3KYH8_9ROSI|nr:Disease resistance protein [Corchorus olitorius]
MSGFFEACGSNALATVFVDYGVKPTVRHVGYVFRFNKIVEDLREKSEQLKVTQASVEARVKGAEDQNQTIDAVVQLWRTEASTLQQDVESFLQVKIQENRRCLINTRCPDLFWRYRLSKQAAKKSLSISDLTEKSKFEVIGHPADLPRITLLPSKEFMPSKSADFAEKQIMEALKNDGVNIIGVWGMGGVGKTTLVKEVGRKAKELKLFGQVLDVVTVSQSPNIEKIQDGIADLLNLTLDKKSETGKAGQLWARLQNEKSILIILDDLWKKLDLKAVGIPVDEHQHKGCKILLTTRSQQVCSDMESGKVVQMNVLGEDEAWQLFKSCAGLDEDTSQRSILDIATEVVKECKGLPIALSSLGKALKGAKLHKWREASQSLKNSTLLEMEGVAKDDKNAYMCLKLSYDFLRLDNTKKCFLLCSLYPEDHSIVIEELVRHAWGLELFKGRNSVQEARNAVCTAMDDLKACSLLLDNGEEWVKMHDMVRDVALWIGSQKQNHFVIKSELGAKEWPSNEKFEHCTAISFMDCNIKGIPERLEYPELGFLSFSDGTLDEGKTMMFSGASFEGMKSLKVLNLVNIKGSLSQDALQMLTNLRCLYLDSCELNRSSSFSSLGNLKKLEILSFYGSDIEILPDEVGELKSLRLLDLSYCTRLKRIPPNVIRRLSQLEELYLYWCGFKFDEWVVEGSTDAEVSNASILELNELSHLTILVLGVGDSERVPKDFVFPKLQNFSIGIGGDADELYPSRRYLKLHKTASFHAFKNLLEVVDVLELNNIVNCQSLVDARNYQHVPVTLSNLSVLKIQDMNCFRGLCNGQPPDGFLKKLETLEITDCGSLKSIFPASITKNLEQLKSVEIVDCDMLEQIFEMEGADDQVLSKLQTLVIKKCGCLKSLFPFSLAQNLLQLKKLVIEDCDMLERLVMEDNNFEMLSNNHYHPRLQELEELEISKCSKLEYVFPSSLVGNDLPRLKNLELTDLPISLKRLQLFGCPKLRPFTVSSTHQMESIQIGGGSHQMCNSNPVVAQGRENSSNMEYAVIGNLVEEMFYLQESGNILSNLEWFQVENLPELRVIWRTPKQLVTLQNLLFIKVVGCNRLRYVFSPLLARNLPKLSYLEIKECEDLEQIVDTSSPEDHHDMQSSLSFPNLQNIEIESCNKLKYVFPITIVGDLRRLYEMRISKASKLERVFGCEDKADAKDHVHQEETVLQLPQLGILFLEELPSLISFSSVDYHFLFPDLYRLKVSDCPQMTTTYSIDSQSCAHAKPQASQQIEDSAATQEKMWPRGSDIDYIEYLKSNNILLD